MYAGFKLSINEYDNTFYQDGLVIYNRNKIVAQNSLKNYINVDGSLNGSAMQNDWFPQIKADIFLSHSHKDINEAITLAGVLSHLGISVFIDSCIWGHASELLKSIDDIYCINSNKTNYVYEERNKSTAHVHMMLSTALNMMIDKCECVFFLNTPNSLSTKGIIDETLSPWIYAEIAMTKLVRKKGLKEYRPELLKSLNESVKLFTRNLEVRYNVNTEHLLSLTENSLRKWIKLYTESIPREEFALDVLYKMIAES